MSGLRWMNLVCGTCHSAFRVMPGRKMTRAEEKTYRTAATCSTCRLNATLATPDGKALLEEVVADRDAAEAESVLAYRGSTSFFRDYEATKARALACLPKVSAWKERAGHLEIHWSDLLEKASTLRRERGSPPRRHKEKRR